MGAGGGGAGVQQWWEKLAKGGGGFVCVCAGVFMFMSTRPLVSSTEVLLHMWVKYNLLSVLRQLLLLLYFSYTAPRYEHTQRGMPLSHTRGAD